MNICFLDFGGFSSQALSWDLVRNDRDLDIHEFSSESELLAFCQQEEPNLVITEYSEVDGRALEFLAELKRIRRNISIINKIPSISTSAQGFLEAGFDSYYYAKDNYVLLHTIRRERKRIQEKKEREMLLHQLESSFREIQFQKFAIDQSAIVTISDKDGNITYVNDRFCDVTGYKKYEIIGKTHKILNSGYHRAALWADMYKTLNEGKVWKGEIRNKKKDGSPIWVEVTIVPFFDSKHKLNKCIAIQFDITFRVLAEERLTRDAFYDPQTNLPNRSLFLAKIEEYIGTTFRDKNLELYVLVLNIKKFNRVNNMFGYAFGDIVLNHAVERIQELTEKYESLLARLGGDSFGLILMEREVKDGFWEDIIQKLHSLFEMPITINQQSVYLEFAVGIAKKGKTGVFSEDLLKNAELAMFEAKYDPHIFYKEFQSDMLIRMQNKLQIQSELKQSLRDGNFYPFYQPIVENKSGKVRGFEMLIRWNHPSQGILSPYFFLEIAEESGLMQSISHQVFEKAFKNYRELNLLSQASCGDFFLSINLSVDQFHEGLPSYLDDLLKKYSINPGNIHLEITESLAMKDIQRTIKILEDCINRGYEISLDDFGTGYSSLSYLKIFPIQHLKIDKSFADEIVTNPKDRLIFESVVKLGASIGLEIIVEGVEKEEQYVLFSELDVGYIQGYYFSKPLSYEAMIDWTKKNLDKSKDYPTT